MQRLAYPLLIAFGIVLIFWKITLSGQFTWMNGDDTVHQVLPWLQMQAREWHRGHFPLLDPFHWAGQSLIGQTLPGATFPLNWLLFVLPLKHDRLQVPILNGYFVFIHILGAWAMFALLRSIRLVRPVAALGAIAFGGGGFMATVEWPQMLNGAMFLPIVLLFWLRFLQFPGRFVFAALAGAAAGVSVLSGHHSAPIIILTMVAGVTVYMLFERRLTRRRIACYAGGLSVFGVFFFLLGAAQSLPAMEYWRVSYRFINTKEPVTFDQQIPFLIHRHFSLNPASLPGLIVNGFHRDAALNPFLGVGVVTLAAFGFIAYRTTLYARLFLFLAIYSLFLAIGEDSLLHGLFFARFPLFEKLRNPSMLILGVHLSLIVLAAMGLDAVRQGKASKEWGVWLVRIGAGSFALLFALYLLDPAKAATQTSFAHSAFFAGGLGLALVAPARWRTKTVLASVLVISEIGSNSTRGFPDREMGFLNFDALSRNDDVAAFLLKQRRDTPFRITIDPAIVPKNFGAWHGIEQVNGDVGMSINMFREQWRPEVPQLLSARYHVGHSPRLPGQIKRFTGKNGMNVWESMEFAPWVWTAHHFERVTEGQLIDRYTSGWPALRDHVFALQGDAQPSICSGQDSVRLTDLRPEYGRVEALMACDGLLVYSSAVLPGWVATVDGQTAPVVEAYGKLLAVNVPRGRHTVEFRYAPRSVWLGALLSLFGLFAAAAWWWISGRREWGFRGLRRPTAT
ncbi:MAG: YfhO family protein [Bryobacteraceae bacterium]